MMPEKSISSLTDSCDIAIVGAGLVGLAIGYGMLRRSRTVCFFDKEDTAQRASRSNFGLIWVQNKGENLPRYAEWSRDSSRLMPALATALNAETGVDVHLEQPGGFYFCWSDEEMARRAESMLALQSAVLGDYPFSMLDHADVRARLPEIGKEVVGACFTPMDGHVNPLKLLLALAEANHARGATYRFGTNVTDIIPDPTGFLVSTATHRVHARKIVLAAGLGIRDLAPKLGLHAPLVPSRGQVLITERVKRFLSFPTNKLRQTNEGTVQIGDSVEDVGFNDSTSHDVMQFMARRAVRTFPILRDARIVRAWGGLRVMTPDGFPIYEESARYPGAFVVTCHSGVTLSAAHAFQIAPWIDGDELPNGLSVLNSRRFQHEALGPMYVN
ncbi:NAD(P)/FAD-dependent oxidoreductase [Achromobacter sp.]|uniref:NAD(P)/FAD-dependent oxidoreductase n=1 Tax=Achromobacter sp. TaxID=134375 RepID=UPI003C764F64